MKLITLSHGRISIFFYDKNRNFTTFKKKKMNVDMHPILVEAKNSPFTTLSWFLYVILAHHIWSFFPSYTSLDL